MRLMRRFLHAETITCVRRHSRECCRAAGTTAPQLRKTIEAAEFATAEGQTMNSALRSTISASEAILRAPRWWRGEPFANSSSFLLAVCATPIPCRVDLLIRSRWGRKAVERFHALGERVRGARLLPRIVPDFDGLYLRDGNRTSYDRANGDLAACLPPCERGGFVPRGSHPTISVRS